MCFTRILFTVHLIYKFFRSFNFTTHINIAFTVLYRNRNLILLPNRQFRQEPHNYQNNNLESMTKNHPPSTNHPRFLKHYEVPRREKLIGALFR